MGQALRTVLMVFLGLYAQYWLLIHVSGFQCLYRTLLCMLLCRAMFSLPYIHVNIFQVRKHIHTLIQASTHTHPQQGI
jgi:fatty acid desaturase 6